MSAPYSCGHHGEYAEPAHHCPSCIREAAALLQMALAAGLQTGIAKIDVRRAIILLGYNPTVEIGVPLLKAGKDATSRTANTPESGSGI